VVGGANSGDRGGIVLESLWHALVGRAESHTRRRAQIVEVVVESGANGAGTESRRDLRHREGSDGRGRIVCRVVAADIARGVCREEARVPCNKEGR
jgi:hypothetical protein